MTTAKPEGTEIKGDAAKQAVDHLVKQGIIDPLQRYNSAQVIREKYAENSAPPASVSERAKAAEECAVAIGKLFQNRWGRRFEEPVLPQEIEALLLKHFSGIAAAREPPAGHRLVPCIGDDGLLNCDLHCGNYMGAMADCESAVKELLALIKGKTTKERALKWVKANYPKLAASPNSGLSAGKE